MRNIKDVVDKLRNQRKARKPSKANRTHPLSEPNYTTFAKYVRSQGGNPSGVIDDLIAMFLEQVKDDLPPDLSYDPRTADGKKSA